MKNELTLIYQKNKALYFLLVFGVIGLSVLYIFLTLKINLFLITSFPQLMMGVAKTYQSTPLLFSKFSYQTYLYLGILLITLFPVLSLIGLGKTVFSALIKKPISLSALATPYFILMANLVLAEACRALI